MKELSKQAFSKGGVHLKALGLEGVWEHREEVMAGDRSEGAPCGGNGG